MTSDASIAAISPPPAVRWLHRAARPTLAVYWALLALGTHWPELQLVGPPRSLYQVAFSPDKIIHAAAFATLMLLLHLARPLGGQARGRTQALAAVLIAMGYALLDEYTQQWVDRTVSIADVVANLIGVLGMYLVITAGPGPRPRRRWVALSARVVWVLVGPALAYLTLSPDAHRIILSIYRWLGLSLGNADKLAHFWLALLLLWLLALAAPGTRALPRLSALLAILTLAVSGPVIELLQHHTGRGFTAADIYAHQVGVLAGVAGWALLRAVMTLAAIRARRTRQQPLACGGRDHG